MPPGRTKHSAQLQTVKTLEEYIEGHWDQPIANDELMLIANVSATGLSKAFKVLRGFSPTDFLIRVRLKRARHMLERAGPPDIEEIARLCCFDNLSYFLRTYHMHYREAPSQTIARTELHTRQAGLPRLAQENEQD